MNFWCDRAAACEEEMGDKLATQPSGLHDERAAESSASEPPQQAPMDTATAKTQKYRHQRRKLIAWLQSEKAVRFVSREEIVTT